MPSASTAKLEKQASSEASDPIKQGIVFIDHKIRNLSKKKGRLDAYKELQGSGKELDADQLASLLKYDEVCQNLAFAQDLSRQLSNISIEWAKGLKKKEKKEAYEREQQEANRVKEILIIQDVLASMGNDTVREDFLAGRNKAVQLTEVELRYLDDLFVEVSPKREPEENQPPFQEQLQSASKHLLNLVEGKDKEIAGTKYSELKKLIEKINTCGYFDHPSTPENAQEVIEEPEVPEEAQVTEHVEPEHEETEPATAPHANFQPHSASLEPVVPVAETAGLYISQRPMADVLTNVMGAGPTAFNFIQESELEPEVIPAQAPMAIPTQTFTNASFAPPAPTAAPVYAPPPQPDVMYSVSMTQAPAQPEPIASQQFEPSNTYQTSSQPTAAAASDWNEVPEQSDLATQVEHSRWNEENQEAGGGGSDECAENSNDGFQTAGRGGSRGRGRGGDRGRGGGRGRGNYQNGRGNQNGRGGYYNRNNSEGGSHYQNGFRDNRDGGPRRGGPRGGGQDRGGPRPDRGSRGSGRGSNPRGNRGTR